MPFLAWEGGRTAVKPFAVHFSRKSCRPMYCLQIHFPQSFYTFTKLSYFPNVIRSHILGHSWNSGQGVTEIRKVQVKFSFCEQIRVGLLFKYISSNLQPMGVFLSTRNIKSQHLLNTFANGGREQLRSKSILSPFYCIWDEKQNDDKFQEIFNTSIVLINDTLKVGGASLGNYRLNVIVFINAVKQCWIITLR